MEDLSGDPGVTEFGKCNLGYKKFNQSTVNIIYYTV